MVSTTNLIQGDCLEVMDKISDNSVDLVVTSPPYDDLRLYNQSTLAWGESIWQSVIEKLYAKVKVGGVVVWVVADATVKGSETGTSFKQALYAMRCGFNLHDTMIWNKREFSAVGSLRVRYAPVFEYMFVFSKGSPNTFTPIKDRKNKHYGSIMTGTKRQKDGSTKRMSGHGEKTVAEFGQRWNVWDISTERCSVKNNHPAKFPIALSNDHIKSWSKVGDTVLDPFMGSGTTGVSCKNLNRNFIGIELDEDYFKIAEERINSA